jgi:hypothetical protein
VVSYVLASVASLTDPAERSWAVGQLAKGLPEPLLNQALGAVQSLTGEDGRAQLPHQVGLWSPEPSKTQLLTDALAAARRIPFEYGRAEVMMDLAPHLPDPA